MNNSFNRLVRRKSNFGISIYIPLIISFVAVTGLLAQMGFNLSENFNYYLNIVYFTAITACMISIIFRYAVKVLRPRWKAIPFDFILLLYLFILFAIRFRIIDENSAIAELFSDSFWIYVAVVLTFVREFSELELNLMTKNVSPARLFIFSFLFIIIGGSLLLMLPNATTGRISYLDSLFTSTSAVCVTGLIVVDTATAFTTFGQIIILMLIQIGGLGIMTFASYFAYFFRGSASFHNQLALQDMTSTERIGEVFAVLKRILFLTFLIEGLGALLIFYTVGASVGSDLADKVFFSVFHAISAFCNGGFSILSNGLFEPIVKFNYPLQWIIAWLIILGGLGFPIIFNLFRYLTTIIGNKFRKLITKKPPVYLPWIININTRIVIITTSVLVIFGWIFFFLTEYNQTLANHQIFGKVTGAFFTSVTTRTAGFNSIDFAAMGVPATLFVIFLMWIGASPASTGGGIKTSTLAVAVLNIFSLAKNRTKIEIYKREIAVSSVQRASAIIMLSIFVIGIAVILLSFTDSDKGLLNLVFETVSAFATVGLSRGITSDLSAAGKIIIMLTMFIGRINMLTILTAFFNKFSSPAYKYPSETILIN